MKEISGQWLFGIFGKRKRFKLIGDIMSSIPDKFDSSYYDEKYFADQKGKEFRRPDGSISNWGYQNLTGEWLGCKPITEAWKELFKLKKCKTKQCKVLDVGCGRGQFVTYLRDIGVEACGFDYSNWAVTNRYPRCQNGWIIQQDATTTWPYRHSSFDLVLALDLFEHIYLDDIDKVTKEMYRVTKKWIFLQIATVDRGSGNGGYILKKGESVPVELEGMAVAGHVTVQIKEFWVDKLMKGRNNKWKLRDDLVAEFIRKVPSDVISNWVKNTLLIIEKV